MNRLSPWIVRAPSPRPMPRRYGGTYAAAMPEDRLGADLRTFLTVYMGGLVFFGTLFG